MKALETTYKGYRFRSRTEARWAIFFDGLGIDFAYEKEGFDLDAAGCYLPDFWLSRHRVWVEVKGGAPTDDERRKAAALARHTECPVVIVSGGPGGAKCEATGVWLPGYTAEVHYGSPALFARHALESIHREGVARSLLHVRAFMQDERGAWNLLDFVLSKGATITASGSAEELLTAVVEADKEYFRGRYGREHEAYAYGWHLPRLCIVRARGGEHPSLVLDSDDFPRVEAPVIAAANAARAARFEHGETPEVASA